MFRSKQHQATACCSVIFCSSPFCQYRFKLVANPQFVLVESEVLKPFLANHLPLVRPTPRKFMGSAWFSSWMNALWSFREMPSSFACNLRLGRLPIWSMVFFSMVKYTPNNMQREKQAGYLCEWRKADGQSNFRPRY